MESVGIHAADLDGLADILAAVLSAEGVPPTAEAGLHLVDEAEMSRLNLDAMGVAGPTDVLSFPLEVGSDVTGARGPAPAADGSAPPMLVGDVVLCPQVAAANAPGHAGTTRDECRLLVVHGGLHLCGWDHGTPDQQRSMWQRERELMDRFGVAPSRDPWTVEP